MKKFLSLALVIVLLLSIAGCSSQKTSDSGNKNKSITLKLGHNSHQDSVTNKALLNWAKIVSEKTGGNLKIEIFPQNQLGSNKELSEQTALGSLDMNVQGLSAYVEYGVEQG